MLEEVIWDRLGGGLVLYVENYLLEKYKGYGWIPLRPSYEVDYEIPDIDRLQDCTDVDDYWVHQIAGCRDINDLPPHLKNLVIQYLPRFFEDFPEYRGAKCLELK